MAYEVSAKSGVEAPLTTQSNPILTAINEVLTEQPGAVDDFRKGKKGAFNFLIGQIMKKTRGCADPAELNRLLLEELKKPEP
jgi:aspartyl-tRNA(Asn)/glutamyl-tRNA(Gln) amidotransferase subunit B